MIAASDYAIVVFAYNRPEKTRDTIQSLQRAIAFQQNLDPSAQLPHVIAAIDGPKSSPTDLALVDEVTGVIQAEMPHATIRRGLTNRSLPAHLTSTLDDVFSTPGTRLLICIEDDVEIAPTLIAAVLHASEHVGREGYVIGAAPAHRDGSLEHQALCLDRVAHKASSDLLKTYIREFSLDGAQREGAYGARDHDAINRWSRAIALRAGVRPPEGTSQDRIRELAWRTSGTQLVGLPMRLVKHRGYWGQHNTPWYALRTGQLFQRLDQRPWVEIAREITALLEKR
ncbi:MAG: hypothetical protein ACKOJD_04975 [Candidatus Limnocylindrus sp.]